eukprot:9717138-Lingulodinium_polyedra.AAC.1
MRSGNSFLAMGIAGLQRSGRASFDRTLASSSSRLATPVHHKQSVVAADSPLLAARTSALLHTLRGMVPRPLYLFPWLATSGTGTPPEQRSRPPTAYQCRALGTQHS